jgi:pyruvate dehydrogenase E1 component beta subunit
MSTVTLGKALNMGLRKAMEDDPKVLLMGEDIGKLGGVFRITDGLQKDFGEDRVIDTPLAESGILPMSIVIRIPFGGGIGAVEHHSESPEAYFAHTAGLKVVACSNPVDAYWMIQQAIAHPDPIVFYEPKRRYWEKAELDPDATPGPLFASRLVREGSQVTVLAYGPMVKTALQAASAAEEEGISVEVLDLRTVSPLDMGPVLDSVRRTGRCVVVHEAPSNLGLGAELSARITEACFYDLEAPVLRVGGYDTPYPPSKLEEDYLPDLDRVLEAVDRSLAF